MRRIAMLCASFVLLLTLSGMVHDAPAAGRASTDSLDATSTAVAALATIEAALTAPSTPVLPALPAPSLDITATIEVAVQTTLTALAPTHTRTPYQAATEAVLAERLATSVAATLTALPTATAPSTPTPQLTPTPAPGAIWVEPKTGIEFVYVPAGEFTMGSDDGGFDERPAHTVYLDAFWIMKTEVTNAQYKQCVDADACEQPLNDQWHITTNVRHPVTHIHWQQAADFAAWVGGRLPTEAEWEKAARGTDGRIYPWGNDEPTDQLLNYFSRVGNTTPVGSYPNGASPYGALDMAGNVWEWVADWYDDGYFANSPAHNPLGPVLGRARVTRGGAWHTTAFYARATLRARTSPTFRSGNLGFRMAVSTDQ
jgi:eukaryotic-like serine/threonine-protein kinase